MYVCMYVCVLVCLSCLFFPQRPVVHAPVAYSLPRKMQIKEHLEALKHSYPAGEYFRLEMGVFVFCFCERVSQRCERSPAWLFDMLTLPQSFYPHAQLLRHVAMGTTAMCVPCGVGSVS